MPETPGYRLDQMMSGLHDGRIKALYLIGENPAQTEPNAHHVEEGLDELEFLVSQDIFLNDSTRKYADVVLPASSLRREGRHVHEHRAAREPRAHGGAAARARRARTGGSSSTSRARSAPRGPSTRTPRTSGTSSPTSAPNWYGIRYDRHRGARASSGRARTATTRARRTSTRRAPARPSGKGKFFPVEYQPPIEQPDSEYPFVLTTGRTLYHYNSATMTMREAGVTRQAGGAVLRDLRRGRATLGIADGDGARLVSRRGELEAQAAISERVYPGLVWMALHFAEAKVNWLTHDVGDPLIGTPEYKVSAVRVEAAA